MDTRVPMAPLLAAFGVPVTVTVPGQAPIETTGIWLQWDERPEMDFSRHDPRRGLALARVDVPAVPRGTALEAPEVGGGTSRAWRVDGMAYSDQDHHCVFVVPVTDES